MSKLTKPRSSYGIDKVIIAITTNLTNFSILLTGKLRPLCVVFLLCGWNFHFDYIAYFKNVVANLLRILKSFRDMQISIFHEFFTFT